MAIDTAADVTQVLEAARDAVTGRDWPLAYGMLLELHGSAACTDAAWTEVRYLLGEACWSLDDLESARRYYDEASVGSGEHAALAKGRMEELARLDEASAAAGDGVTADEQTGLVSAADEAKARGDYDTAVTLYRQAYDARGGDPVVNAWTAVDLGECYVKLNQYDTAREWLDWAVIAGDDGVKAKAQAALDQLNAIDAAKEMASDGTRSTEVIAVFSAAREAYDNGDDDTALALWESMLPSPVLSAKSRAGVLFNIAQVLIHKRDYDGARARFEEARQYAADDQVGYLDERLGMLESRDEAMHTAGLLPIEEE